MSHTYLGQDQQGGAQFLLSFIGDKLPEYWKKAAEKKIAACEKVFEFSDLSELQSWSVPFIGDNKKPLAEAEELLEQARHAFAEQRYVQAYSTGDQALRLARESFLIYCPPRNGEMRGVWIHSPYGIADWGWDRTVEVLAKNGFNAIFPNFLWGYVADYPSEVLPNHPKVSGPQGKIDYLQQCLEACRKYQVELHIWKVNWNMGHRTPEDLRQKMRILGRTQVTFDGRDSDYLSPHHPENFALERDSMLEIVRKYPVDGIHFDYIRYPNNNTDFSFDARIAFEQHLGRPVHKWPDDCLPRGVDYQAYAQWRRDNISKLVREVSLEARKIRPGIKVSAAIYGDWESARLSVAQDASAWIDEGLLDFICPMNYTLSAADFVHLLQKQLLRVGNRIPVYPGIGVYLLPDATAVAEQIMLSRKHGADGFVCFQHSAEFAEAILPGLRRGVSSLTVTEPLPHHGQPLKIKLSDSQLGLPFGFYSLSEPLLAELLLPENVNPSAFRVNLLRNGWDTAPDAKFNLRREQQTLFYRLDIGKPGHYRLELRGENELGLPLLSRGESFQVLSADDERELLRREGTPDFADNGGLKVAVWQYQSYGGELILDFLRQQPDLDTVALYNLHPATLRACQVIVIPQPKEQSEEFKKRETGSLLNAFIRQGGGLLLTHAMIGSRGFVNPVPELIESVPEPPLNSPFWRVRAGHPAVSGIDEIRHESAYPFIVSMRPSASATVLASGQDEAAVITAGELDKGRYVGCGLGLGLGRGEVAAPLSATEQRLLLNIIDWLSHKKDPAAPPATEK